MSVCPVLVLNFECLDLVHLFLGSQTYLQNVYVKFVYKGHLVTFEVIGAESLSVHDVVGWSPFH